ncbi:MAG TPA: FUSC family protein, partial [Acidimicrobiales bacterium]
MATAVVGAALAVIGTAASDNAVAAALVTAAAGFGLTYVGVLGGYTVVMRTPLLLSVVLAASVEAPFSAASDRVAGWLIGAGVSTLVALFLWPRRDHDAILRAASDSCDRFAAIIRAGGDPDEIDAARAVARTAHEATSLRTAGTTSRQRAFALLVEELDMFAELLPAWFAASGRSPVPRQDVELVDAVAATMEGAGRRLRGESAPLDLTRLDHARADQRAAVEDWAAASLRAGRPATDVLAALDAVRPLRLLSHVAVTAGDAATLATGGAVPTEWVDLPPRAQIDSGLGAAAVRAGRTLAAHFELRSVRFRDSLRAAVAFSLAVLVARLARLDHAFWAVLGSISVLRTSVTGAGRTALQAMLGTVIGFVVVVPLMLLMGSNTAALWVVLPIAAAVAGYSSVRWPLAAGQAAFTVLVVVLFNLIEPTGWKVGAVRVLDVATGCLVAVFVSLVFWPRGARTQVRRALADQFATAGAYLGACFQRVLSPTALPTPSPQLHAALDALRRARDALGDLIEERGPAAPETTEAIGQLATGLGVRISAERINELAPTPFQLTVCPDAAAVVRREAGAAADAISRIQPVATGDSFAAERGAAVAGCLAQWDGTGDEAARRNVMTLVWVSQWVIELARLSRRLEP